jgi:hypothetical protein
MVFFIFFKFIFILLSPAFPGGNCLQTLPPQEGVFSRWYQAPRPASVIWSAVRFRITSLFKAERGQFD